MCREHAGPRTTERDDIVSERPAASDRAVHSAAAFELIEHPADVKLRAWGATLQQLFANAAQGMMVFLFGGEIAKARPERTDAFEIEAPDREALLVDWLSELLYRACSEYHAYVEFCVREMSDRRLVATAGVVSAEAIDDIKAVTHHELSIRARDGGGWEATVVFDI
jgi:SHS2 domain-containing protein